jgi:hypothetical protein
MNDYRVFVFIVLLGVFLFYNCKIYETYRQRQTTDDDCDIDCLIDIQKKNKKDLLKTLENIKDLINNMFNISYNDNTNRMVKSVPLKNFRFETDLNSFTTVDLMLYFNSLNNQYYSYIDKIQMERNRSLSYIEQIKLDLKQNLNIENLKFDNFEGNCNIYSQKPAEYCSSIVDEENRDGLFNLIDKNIELFQNKFDKLNNSLIRLSDLYNNISRSREEFGNIGRRLNEISTNINDAQSVFRYNQ